MSLFKAQAHMRELRQRLDAGMSGKTFADALDTSGMPVLVVTDTGSTEKHFIKIETLDNAGRVDALGLPQRVYSPHKCTLIQEAAATPPAATSARLHILAAIAKLGMKLFVSEGTGVKAAADYAAAEALISSTVEIKSDEFNPLTQSQ